MDAFFANIRRQSIQTTAGPCDLPILYQDASMVWLTYRVAAERARSLMGSESGPFEPWVLLGKAIAVVCAFEYRTTTIGPYGEIGLAIFVKRKKSRPSLLKTMRDLRADENTGLFVVNLPVTTDAARAAGVQLWGFPKYVADMRMAFRPDGARVVLEREFEITMGPQSPAVDARGLPFVTFSISPEGRVIRTIVEVDHTVRWGGSRTVSLHLTGDGPTARTMATLGLDRIKPSLVFRSDRLRAILPLGKDMGSAGTSVKADRAQNGATADSGAGLQEAR